MCHEGKCTSHFKGVLQLAWQILQCLDSQVLWLVDFPSTNYVTIVYKIWVMACEQYHLQGSKQWQTPVLMAEKSIFQRLQNILSPPIMLSNSHSEKIACALGAKNRLTHTECSSECTVSFIGNSMVLESLVPDIYMYVILSYRWSCQCHHSCSRNIGNINHHSLSEGFTTIVTIIQLRECSSRTRQGTTKWKAFCYWWMLMTSLWPLPVHSPFWYQHRHNLMMWCLDP